MNEIKERETNVSLHKKWDIGNMSNIFINNARNIYDKTNKEVINIIDNENNGSDVNNTNNIQGINTRSNCDDNNRKTDQSIYLNHENNEKATNSALGNRQQHKVINESENADTFNKTLKENEKKGYNVEQQERKEENEIIEENEIMEGNEITKEKKIIEEKKIMEQKEMKEEEKKNDLFNGCNKNVDDEKLPPKKKEKTQYTDTNIYKILNEINSKEDKKEIETFLNYLLLYESNTSVSILGNIISFYICDILSEDLSDLKNNFHDGVKLSVKTFFNTLKEMDNSQLLKMTNIYLNEYFSKIFKILKSNNISLCFDNVEINRIKLLQIYNILGVTRNGGKRKKQENVKKFLYQHICVENKQMALLKNNKKMQFLTSIIQNGAIVRMHLSINVTYDLSSFNTVSSNIIAKTKIKNMNLYLVLENELTNPCLSINSNETINLKASGWYLADVNDVLNGNLPYEKMQNA